MNEAPCTPTRVSAANADRGLIHARPWTRDAAAIAAELETDLSRGLSTAQAAERLTRVGPNELVIRKQKLPRPTLFEQSTSFLVLGLSFGLIVVMLVAEL